MGRISLGISLGGIIVILGFVTMTFWSFWIGVIVTIIGLILFIPTKNRPSKPPAEGAGADLLAGGVMGRADARAG